MNNWNDIENELKSLSPYLAGLAKVNPFVVPEGYFQSLNDNILERTVFLPSFNNIDFQSDSKVPAGYFESFPGLIMEKIKDQEKIKIIKSELRELSSMLYSIQGDEVYTVPSGYFESFPEVMLSRVQEMMQPAKVVAFKKRSLWKMAAAAVVTGLIATTTIWMSAPESQTSTTNSIAKVEVVTDIKAAQNFQTETAITKEIATLSQDDILSYLVKTGSDEDLELVASTINEEDLPEQNDYLLDEQALNKYLESLNIESHSN